MRRSGAGRWVHGALLLGGLVACNPSGLQPVDDTGTDDTGTDTGEGVEGLIGILISPERAAIPLGGQLQLVATGLRDDRTSLDVPALATWVSDRPSVAKVSDDLDSEGLLTGLAVGEAKVFADVAGVQSVPIKVTVTDSALLGLSVKPDSLTVSKGAVAHLTAEAAFSDGTRSDASNQVIWVTGNGDVATLETGGKLTAVNTGTTTVHAEWEGKVSPTVPVQVVVGADPDLTIQSAEIVAGGGDATLTVVLENRGNAGASEFWVDVFVDPLSAPTTGMFGDYYVPIDYADAGEEIELSFTFGARAGTHTVWVVADIDDAVAESVESNNALEKQFQFGSGASSANLKITLFDYYADATDVLFVIDVHNNGSASVVEDFYVDLWFDADLDPTPSGVGDKFLRVEGLAAGATEFVDFVVPRAEIIGCPCKSWAMVDTNGGVPETNEGDNIAGPMTLTLP